MRRSCQGINKGIRKVQTFQAKNKPIKTRLWSVCQEISVVSSPQQRDSCRSNQGSGNSDHEATNHSQGVEEFFGQSLLHQKVHPQFSIDHFGFYKSTKKGIRLRMGGSTTDSFSKAIVEYDEPPHSTSPSPQKTIAALPSFKLVCHWSSDSLGG